jgi:hypothetical protein
MFGEAKLWAKICMSIGTEAYPKKGCSQSLIIRIEYYKRSKKQKDQRAEIEAASTQILRPWEFAPPLDCLLLLQQPILKLKYFKNPSTFCFVSANLKNPPVSGNMSD